MNFGIRDHKKWMKMRSLYNPHTVPRYDPANRLGPHTLLRQINHGVLCYVNLKLSRNQSLVSLLFSVLWDSIVDWILDNFFSILNSWFTQESRIENRVKNEDSQWTVNLLLNGTALTVKLLPFLPVYNDKRKIAMLGSLTFRACWHGGREPQVG